MPDKIITPQSSQPSKLPSKFAVIAIEQLANWNTSIAIMQHNATGNCLFVTAGGTGVSTILVPKEMCAE